MVPLNLSASTSVASRSGDASAGLTTPFQYNGQFTVGSGAKATTEAAANSADAGAGAMQSNILLYVGIGAVVLIAVAVLANRK